MRVCVCVYIVYICVCMYIQIIFLSDVLNTFIYTCVLYIYMYIYAYKPFRWASWGFKLSRNGVEHEASGRIMIMKLKTTKYQDMHLYAGVYLGQYLL